MQFKLALDSIRRWNGNSKAMQRRQKMLCDFPHTLASHHANMCFMLHKCEPNHQFFLLPIPDRPFDFFFFCLPLLYIFNYLVTLKAVTSNASFCNDGAG